MFEDMYSALTDGHVFWLLLGISLICIEILTGTFVFLAMGSAALVIGLLHWLTALTLAGPHSLIAFAAGSVALAFAYRRIFKSWGETKAVSDPNDI